MFHGNSVASIYLLWLLVTLIIAIPHNMNAFVFAKLNMSEGLDRQLLLPKDKEILTSAEASYGKRGNIPLEVHHLHPLLPCCLQMGPS
ncbi:hypothetical protein XENTR_v10017642 [Xenopus tropicalis]|nr:hypothetical protein XENTR_v10017642 [Xenopus tropicalis]